MDDKLVDMPKCMADKYETADFIASDPPPSSSQGGIPGGTRRSVGSLLRGSRSGIERRSSGRRSGWTGSLVAVLTGG